MSEKMSNPIPGRKITKEATKDFISLATSIDWDIFENEADDQKYYTGVLDKIEKIVDEAFPIRIAVPKVSKITPPWFTKGLAESSKCKKKLFAKYKRKPTPQNEQKYKEYCKIFQRTHRNMKADYYSKQFDKYASDVKATWKILRVAIGYSKTGVEKFPDYFFEEILQGSGSDNYGGGLDGGGDGDCASAQTPSPPTSKTSPSSEKSQGYRYEIYSRRLQQILHNSWDILSHLSVTLHM